MLTEPSALGATGGALTWVAADADAFRTHLGAAVQGQAAFQTTAVAVEDLGVSAYAGQGPRLKQVPVIQAALAIHSVEARHAAWIRSIVGKNPAPAAFDPARTMKQVLAVAGGFVRA